MGICMEKMTSSNKLVKGLILVYCGLMLSSASLMADNLNMKDANIRVLIEAVSRITGKTFVLDPRVNNQKITILSPANVDLSKDEIYQIFLSALKMNQLTAVEDGAVIRVTQDSLAKSEPVPVGAEGDSYPGDLLITRVVKVNNVDAKQLTPVLRPLIRQTGHMAVYGASNVIVIHDRASNIERLVEIIRQVDRESDVAMEIIPLEHANAAEIVRILDSLQKRGGAQAKAANETTVLADERTNSVLVSGDTNSRLRLRAIIAQLDSPQESSGNSRVYYLKYAKADELKNVLMGQAKIVAGNSSASSGGQAGAAAARSRGPGGNTEYHIESHEATNSLIITAPPDMMKTFESIIRQLDIRLAQVLVEAIIVEVSESTAQQLGVQWLFAGNGGSAPVGATNFTNIGTGVISVAGAAAQNRGLDNGQTTVVNPDTGVSTTTTNRTNGDNGVALGQLLSGVQGLAIGVANSGLDWGMFVQALGSNTDTNILSTPSIMALDNQEASIHVGQEVPIITGSAASSNNNNPFQTFDRQEVGVKLDITPQINEGDAVILKLSQEVSSVAGATSTDIVINKRSINTSVLVESGSTIVIGGLIDDDIQESTQKIPLLGDIPLLGNLFKSQGTTKSKRNLMVFIRPTIVRDEASVAEVTGKKYNFMRAQQLDRQTRGIQLISDDENMPVLPKFDESLALPPSFEEVQKKSSKQDGSGDN
jgi:general secretion pathway protein D